MDNDEKEYNLIDPDDPTRKRIITIDGNGRVISLKEQGAKEDLASITIANKQS